MSKGLEALERITKHCETDIVDEDLCEVGKALKTLEVFKKVANINRVYRNMAESGLECGWITQEEYDLLKEELK